MQAGSGVNGFMLRPPDRIGLLVFPRSMTGKYPFALSLSKGSGQAWSMANGVLVIGDFHRLRG